MNDKADFTQGSILKKLIAFMMPVLGALILQAAYGAVDLLVVGRFGSTSGLSAVSTGIESCHFRSDSVCDGNHGFDSKVSGRKETGSDRFGYWRLGSCIYYDCSLLIYRYGRICTSDLSTDAGSKRSS